MRDCAGSILLLMTMVALLTGCSGGSDEAPETTAPTMPSGGTERSAGTLPIPGQPGGMPSDHPPTGGAGQVVWSVPQSWTEKPPSSNMRIAQYSVDGPAGPAECVVFYFGPNQGGDSMANAQRWAGQFSQPDGRSSVELMTMTQVEGSRLSVRVVEVTGTYEGGMTMSQKPFEPKTGYMLLGGIVDGPDAPWFFKFTGPEATVRAQKDAFVEMMKSVRVEG
jgi:hypothetical protein